MVDLATSATFPEWQSGPIPKPPARSALMMTWLPSSPGRQRPATDVDKTLERRRARSMSRRGGLLEVVHKAPVYETMGG